jgi:hypothetical protein
MRISWDLNRVLSLQLCPDTLGLLLCACMFYICEAEDRCQGPREDFEWDMGTSKTEGRIGPCHYQFTREIEICFILYL